MYKKTNSYNTDELFKNGSIIRFPDMIIKEQQRLGYKISHHKLPEPLLKMFDVQDGKKNTQIPY